MNELTNQPQIAPITGAAGGIGRQLCIGLADAGYRLIVTDLAPHAFDHPKIHFHLLDLRDEQAITRLFTEVRTRHDGIHLLINNGAISKIYTRFEDLSAAQFDQVMTVNVRGAMLYARAFVQANRGLPAMAASSISPPPLATERTGLGCLRRLQGGAGRSHPVPRQLAGRLPHHGQCHHSSGLDSGRGLPHPDRGRSSPVPEWPGRAPRRHHPRLPLSILALADPRNELINGANLVVDGGMSKKMIYHTSFW